MRVLVALHVIGLNDLWSLIEVACV
jgi:hypothetical protein